MKTLHSALMLALLSATLGQAAHAGAPPKIDPNAPPAEYFVEPGESDKPGKKQKKEKIKKEKKAGADEKS